MRHEIKLKRNFNAGRGAQVNPNNPFENRIKSTEVDEIWIDDELPEVKTRIVDTHPTAPRCASNEFSIQIGEISRFDS